MILIVEDLERGDAEVAILFDVPNFLPVGRYGHFLIAATLASTHCATQGAFQRHELGGCVQFLHNGRVGVDGRATNTAAAVILVQRMSHLIVADKILELVTGLATEKLHAPTPPSLADIHFAGTPQVSSECIRAAIHLLLHHASLFWREREGEDEGEERLNTMELGAGRELKITPRLIHVPRAS